MRSDISWIVSFIQSEDFAKLRSSFIKLHVPFVIKTFDLFIFK